MRRRKWQPTAVLLPGKFHGWRSLVGCSPWGRKESDTTEQLHFLSFYSFCWRRKWQPTPVFLPRESHGRRGLVGCGLWGCKEWDTTKQLTHTRTTVMEIKAKRNKWDLIELLRFLHDKRNHKQNEKIDRWGEYICKRCNWQGINFQNIQIADIPQYKKTTQQSNQKKSK